MADGPNDESTTETPAKSPSFARRLLSATMVLLAVAVAGAAGLAYWAYQQYTAPGPLTESRVVLVRKGSGVNQIAAQLAHDGIIADAGIFRMGLRFLDRDGSLKAGEYRFPAAITMRQVRSMMVRGETVLRRFTVAEGLTTLEIFDIIAGTEALEGEISLKPEEGRFLPETYYYSLGDSRDTVLGRMRDAMHRTLDELWESRAADLPFKTKEEALILASIIEKETGVDPERGLIAGVFVNRLRKGMRLQTDPTVIYGITNGKGPLGRPLRRSELDRATPYNTYMIGGLPPGPIANPGRESIAAALKPAKTKHLYFVADGTGGHAFARTGKEHERNVLKWRKIQREQRRKK